MASGGTTYQWSPDSTLSNAFIAAPSAFPTLSATYQVIVTNANNCSDTTQVTVTVNPSPAVDAGLDQTICIGDTVQLGASGGLFYLWTPADSLSATTTACLLYTSPSPRDRG